MPPPFRKFTLAEFGVLLRSFPFSRQINAVHLHPTLGLTQAQFQGEDSLVSLWRLHTSPPLQLRDLAQHLTIGPDGSLWLGRSWDLPPASAAGHNGTAAAGPFMITLVGDFRPGQDAFADPQREVAAQVIALLQDRFHLPLGSLLLQHQLTGGDDRMLGISFTELLQEVRNNRREAVTDTSAEATPEMASAAEALGVEAPEAMEALVLSMLREGVTPGPWESPDAEVRDPGAEAPHPRCLVPAAAIPTEGLFGPPPITADMKEAMRPHVVTLHRGRLRADGGFPTSREEVDAIFEEHLERAVAGKTAQNPLRLVLWAHGGLVPQDAGLKTAYRHLLWWKRNGVYPLYFVWETGLLDSLQRLLTGRSGGQEAIALEGISDVTDAGIERLARGVRGSAIWSDMKQSAFLAAQAPDGGAAYAAQKLAEFCKRHPDVVEIHACGHSAGAIFHADFLPVAFQAGSAAVRNLFLLAPAIRVDRFKERLAPHIGEGRAIRNASMFTMNRIRELDDNCLGLYRKSLLYLIHYSLENVARTPILGLEISLRADAELKALFGLGVAGAPGEVIWSKTPPDAPPDGRSTSLHHGDFDNDAATLDSLLRRVLGRTEIPYSYAQAEQLTPESALASMTPAPPTSVTPPAPAGEDGTFILGDAAEPPPAEGPEPAESEPDEEGATLAGITAEEIQDLFERLAELEPEEEAVLAEAAGMITFGPRANQATVSNYTRGVIKDLLQRAGVPSVVITSTARTPADQARAMYQNLVAKGVAHQKALYAAPGRKVIDAYVAARHAGKSPAQIQAAMTAEILRQGPGKVSRHCADHTKLNVVDIAPNSVANRAKFRAAIKADSRVSKLLEPPSDPAYHLEIPQPGHA